MTEKMVVSGGPVINISKELSFGKYVLNKFRSYCGDDKIALINALNHEAISYDHLVEKIVGVANGLRNMRIGKGDVIAICSENRYEFIVVTIAGICAGATITTFGAKHTKGEILHALSIIKPKMIFCSQSSIERKLHFIREAPCLRHVVQLNGTVKEPGVLSLDALIVESNVEDYEPEPVNGTEDVAFVIYGAGTTGEPKAPMLTHYNVIYGAYIFDYGTREQTNVLSVPPWYNLYAMLTTIQYLVDANLLVYLADFDLDRYFAAIEKYQITKLISVPKVLAHLAKAPVTEKYDLSSVKAIWFATIPICPVTTMIAAKKHFPNCRGIFQAHGLTETSLVVLKELEKYDEKCIKEGSCGVLLPGFAAKVVDINTGEKLGAYENGEICLKGPTMLKGFLGNEKATREIYDEEGYIKTGDVGYYDTNGNFYITDLVKEIIIYMGQQVSPATIESVILQHKAVLECGVVGARDEAAGELPTAFVVRKPGATLTERELLDFTEHRLPTCCQLHGGVKFVEEIPKSETGKILRRVLRNQLRDYNYKN